jgi:dipeptide/tripeptide permease
VPSKRHAQAAKACALYRYLYNRKDPRNKERLMTRLMTAALLGFALTAAPIAASQATARATQPVSNESALAADSNLFFILGVVAVAAGIVLLQEDEEGAPASP